MPSNPGLTKFVFRIGSSYASEKERCYEELPQQNLSFLYAPLTQARKEGVIRTLLKEEGMETGAKILPLSLKTAQFFLFLA